MLERTRLSLLTLFRALDLLSLAQEIPAELHELFELDADLVEVLWVMDQPAGRFDLSAMTADTMASLGKLPDVLRAFFALLSPAAQAELSVCADAVRATLAPSDAYLQIPGRDPAAPATRGIDGIL